MDIVMGQRIIVRSVFIFGRKQILKKKFDSVGNELNEGDDVTIVLDLKLGGDTIKRGTKAKNIQFLDKEVDGHDIQGRVDGFGNLYLKTSVVKKL